MQKNIGYTDSFIRLIAGIAFLLNFIILNAEGIKGILFLFFGFLFIFNFILRYSILYEIINFSTIKK